VRFVFGSRQLDEAAIPAERNLTGPTRNEPGFESSHHLIYRPRAMVVVARFSPPAVPSRSRARLRKSNLSDSSQLRARPPGVHWSPTRAAPLKSQLLYQLSYAGAPVIVFAESSSRCRRGHGCPPALLSKLLSNPKTVVKPQASERGKLLVFRDLVSDVRNLRSRARGGSPAGCVSEVEPLRTARVSGPDSLQQAQADP